MVARVRLTARDRAAVQALRDAAGQVDDLTELMDRIGAALVASTQLRFEDQRSPAGVPWQRSRRAASVGGQTLVDSGRLRASITHRPGPTAVEVGTNVGYAGTHQFGATIAAKTPKGLRFRIGNAWVTKRAVTIPARPFLGLDAADREHIPAIAAHWLRERLGDGAPA